MNAAKYDRIGRGYREYRVPDTRIAARSPQAYLDPGVRAAISTFARLSDVESRLQRLRADLDNGDWHARYGELLENEYMDYGYRVLLLQAEN